MMEKLLLVAMKAHPRQKPLPAVVACTGSADMFLCHRLQKYRGKTRAYQSAFPESPVFLVAVDFRAFADLVSAK